MVRWADLSLKRVFFPMLIFLVAPVGFILAVSWGRCTYKGVFAFSFMWVSLFWVCWVVTAHFAFSWFAPGGMVALLFLGIVRLVSMETDSSRVQQLMIVFALNLLGIWAAFTAISVSALYLLPDQAWLWLLVLLLMLCQIPICTKASINPEGLCSGTEVEAGRQSLRH